MQGPVVQKPISANFILNIIMASKFRLIFSKPCRLHSGLNICYLIYLRRYIYKLYSDFKNYYWEKRWISPISILSQMKRKGYHIRRYDTTFLWELLGNEICQTANQNHEVVIELDIFSITCKNSSNPTGKYQIPLFQNFRFHSQVVFCSFFQRLFVLLVLLENHYTVLASLDVRFGEKKT